MKIDTIKPVFLKDTISFSTNPLINQVHFVHNFPTYAQDAVQQPINNTCTDMIIYDPFMPPSPPIPHLSYLGLLQGSFTNISLKSSMPSPVNNTSSSIQTTPSTNALVPVDHSASSDMSTFSAHTATVFYHVNHNQKTYTTTITSETVIANLTDQTLIAELYKRELIIKDHGKTDVFIQTEQDGLVLLGKSDKGIKFNNMGKHILNITIK